MTLAHLEIPWAWISESPEAGGKRAEELKRWGDAGRTGCRMMWSEMEWEERGGRGEEILVCITRPANFPR